MEVATRNHVNEGSSLKTAAELLVGVTSCQLPGHIICQVQLQHADIRVRGQHCIGAGKLVKSAELDSLWEGKQLPTTSGEEVFMPISCRIRQLLMSSLQLLQMGTVSSSSSGRGSSRGST